MADDEPTALPPIGQDTWPDRVARFGCGASLAILVCLALLFGGAVDALTAMGATLAGLGLILAAGAAAVVGGDRAIRVIWKVLNWLT